MARKKEAVEAVAEAVEAKKEPEKAAEEPRFPIAKLAANKQKLFGVSSCTFAGATYGMTGEYTVKEIKARIEKWCGTEAR